VPTVIEPGPLLFDTLRTLLALAVGYVVGSLPISAWVGRAAGVDVTREGERRPGSAKVWRLAGPGWGVLALTGELAKGILPVAVGIVTFTWWTGWVAGVGVLTGAGWPAFGRLPGGRGSAALAGTAIALAPLAGTVGLALTLLIAAMARLLGRNGRVVAIASGLGAFPVLFLAEHRDLTRLAGLGILYLVAVARYGGTRR
jgi:glycerol-3-phosphate acyltransferase PlsY